MSRLRPALLAAAAVLALSACHRGRSDDSAATPTPPENKTSVAPAPPPVAAPAAPKSASLSTGERRRLLRAEKDGEAQAGQAPEYEGARGAATALPSQGDDTPASPADPAPGASPPPSPPGQPPG